MRWEKYWMPPAVTAADRARQYDKARKTLGAARGWEPWKEWEDRLVAHLAEGTATLYRTVRDLAGRLERTENAILCRIEKRYGAEMRAHFTTFAPQYHNGCPKPRPEPCWSDAKGWYVPQPDTQNLEQQMNDDQSKDKSILDGAIMDIARARNHPFFDPARFAYRVTPTEYRAIGREIERRQYLWGYKGDSEAPRTRDGAHFATITLCGVRLTRSAEPVPVPIIKDYGTSG